MSHKILWFILVLTMMGITGCDGEEIGVTPEATPDSVQVKWAAMKGAYELGETLFLYDAPQSTRYALFCGGQRIVFLKACTLRSVKLTSNECLNLEVKKECGDGDWCAEYAFQNVGPGDYVFFESGLWRVTHYTP